MGPTLAHASAALNVLPRSAAKARFASAVSALDVSYKVCLTTARARSRRKKLGLIKGSFNQSYCLTRYLEAITLRARMVSSGFVLSLELNGKFGEIPTLPPQR